MNKWPLFLLIFLSSSLNAGWANYWHSIKHTLKSVFSHQYVVRQQLIADLNSCNQLLKADIGAQREQRRKEANDALAAEIKKQGISNFFTQSKPSFSTIGIFNTSEAAFLLNEIKSKITTDKQKLAELQSSESNEDSRISKSEKRPSIRDMRELMELGAYEHNSNMSKSALYFK